MGQLVTFRAVPATIGAIVATSIAVWAHQESAAPMPAAGVSSAATLRARGIDLGYNLDYSEALAAFHEASAVDPDDPTAPCLAAGAAWIGLLFEQGAITVDDYLGEAQSKVERAAPSAAADAEFHDNLARAQRLAEVRLREHPADAEAHYRVGAVYGFLASYTATVEGRVLGSLGPGRRAYREHERTLELDPRRKDAGLIVGLYRYTVAALPLPLRLMARLAGFDGDRAGGLRLVEDAARYPSDLQANALFTLIVMYTRESRYDDALAAIAELQRRYPRNRLLWLEAGSTALRARRPAEARVALEAGLAILSRDPRPRAVGEDARWHYAYGAALVALRDVAPAERELRIAVACAARDWVRGRAHRELGKLADLASDRARALGEYRLAERLCRQDHDSDCSNDVRALMKTAYR
jgi:tetratricopeptide (TPR) repeat protein